MVPVLVRWHSLAERIMFNGENALVVIFCVSVLILNKNPNILLCSYCLITFTKALIQLDIISFL